MTTVRIIHIEPAAPPKPAPGQPCNGCGVCCLYEPCPLGRLVMLQRSGPCAALRWDAAQGLYRCGALAESRDVLRRARLWPLRWLAAPLSPWLTRWAGRWIAAGQGCDCELQAEREDGSPQN